MNTRTRWGIFAILLLIWFGAVCPASGESPYAHPFSYETVRTLAMGGTSVAVADDEQALFTNPAGLGQIEDKGFAVLNAKGEINQDFRRVKNKTDGLSDADTPQSRASNDAILTSVMGQRARTSLSNLAYYLGGKGFGAGFLYQETSEIRVIRPTSPKLRTMGDIDSVLTGSIARPIMGSRTVFNAKANGWWGATLKFISRRSIDREYDARDFGQVSENDLRRAQFKGPAVDCDGGILWRLRNPYNQTVGLFVGNLFESEFDPLIGHLHRQVGIGTALRPLFGPQERNDKLLLTADLWDINGEGTFWSRLRLGAEARLRSWLKIQGGIRGGYLTAGASGKFREARVQIATYSEETGTRPGDLEDRRYSLSINFEF